MITADHGCDPAAAHSDHTREHVPLLARFDGDHGRRHDGALSDVGASVLRWLTGADAAALPGDVVRAGLGSAPMPELPEVETIRSQLAPLVEGRTLRTLEVLDPKWCAPLDPQALRDALEGRVLERLQRRGKYLIWEAQDDVYLLMHLRMTGTLLYDAQPGTLYTRVRFDARRRPRAELLRPAPLRHRRARARSAPRSSGSSTPGSASSRWAPTSRPSTCYRRRASGARRSRRCCSTSAASRASATSTPTRRCFAPASIRCAAPARSSARRSRRCATRSSRRSRPASTPAAPRSTTSATPTASTAPFRTSSSSTAARASRASSAAPPVRKFVAAGRGTYACETCQTRPRRRPGG